MERTKTKRFIKEEKGKLVKDKRAVSPVIAEILTVAIVVILAAVIAAFVFGITPGTESAAPQASFEVKSCSAATGGIVLGHQGGDSVAFADITGTVDPDGAAGGNVPMTAAWAHSVDVNNNGIIDPGDQINSIGAATGPTAEQPYAYTIFHQPSGQLIATGEVTATA